MSIQSNSVAQISTGATFPVVTAKGATVVEIVKINELVATGKHVIVFVPGAFTPTCSSQIPEYISRAAEFQGKGIDSVIFSTVNDAFVVSAWSKTLLAKVESPSSILKFVADDTGSLAASLGLLFDISSLLGNFRAKRAAVVVDGGKIAHVFVEEDPSKITVSGAEALLAKL